MPSLPPAWRSFATVRLPIFVAAGLVLTEVHSALIVVVALTSTLGALLLGRLLERETDSRGASVARR